MKTTAIPHEDEALNRGVAYFTFVLGLTILMLTSLSSCNTARGFGRDVEKVGNKIERTADKVANH